MQYSDTQIGVSLLKKLYHYIEIVRSILFVYQTIVSLQSTQRYEVVHCDWRVSMADSLMSVVLWLHLLIGLVH